MAMNIKNPEAEKLAQKVARLTGESKTAAITQALRERLAQLPERDTDELVERLLQIGRKCAARLREPYKTIDHGEMLYDEKGLPK